MRERTNDDMEDEYLDRQARNADNCKCSGEMPGSCPGPHNCPMCQPDEDEAIASDLAYNASKSTAHQRSDARALRDQTILSTLLRASI